MSTFLLKSAIKVNRGKYFPQTFNDSEKGNPLINVSSLRTGEVNAFVNDYNKVFENEILIIADGANTGELFKSHEGILSSTIWHLEINKKYNKDLLYYQLKNKEHQIKSQKNNVFVNHLKEEDINYLELKKYSKNEEELILNNINKKYNVINSVINLLNKKEQDLNNYFKIFMVEEFKNNTVKKRVKDVFNIKSGNTPSKTSKNEIKNIPLISAKDIKENKNNEITEYISVKDILINRLNTVKENTLLMSIVGANSGRVSLSKEKLCHTQSVISLNKNKLLNEVAYYYFNYVKTDWTEESKGAGMLSINSTKVKNETIYIPKENVELFLTKIRKKEQSILKMIEEIKKQKKEFIELKKVLIKDL